MSYLSSPSTLEEDFDRVVSRVLNKLRNKVSFPKEVVWVLGPSKSGKTAIANYIAETRKHKRPPVTLTFKGGDFEAWLEQLLFELVIMKSRDGVVVDDFFVFPDQCVASLRLIHKFLGQVRSMKTRRGRNNNLPFTRFHFVFLTASREVLQERAALASPDSENIPGRIERQLQFYTELEPRLTELYAFRRVDTSCDVDESKKRVMEELGVPNNGYPLKYKVKLLNILPRDSPSFFPRSHSYHPGTSRTPAWRNNDYGPDGPPPPAAISPFGSNSYFGSMTPHSHSYTSNRFTFPDEQRSSPLSRSYSNNSTSLFDPGTPRAIPTSCRLSQMAEKDRYSMFPSSTRNYKPVAQPYQQSMAPPPPEMGSSNVTPSSMRRMSIKSTDSSKIRDVFLQICAGLEARFGKENLIYPREIIWMIGPPGAGKSTLARFLSEQREYASEPVVLREICQLVIAQNDGKLKIEQVVEQLMVKLFDEKYAYGVVVDGFVSITCARVVPFMFKYFLEIYDLNQNMHPPVFKFCVLYVNEDNSVRRQIVNYEQGEKKAKQNKKFDAEEGRKLYRKFLKRTQQVVELIEMHFSFHLIDANGTLAQVQLMASAEIASETNGALIHDATLVKALSPAANSNRSRRNHGWKSNSYRNSNRSKRDNSFRKQSYRRQTQHGSYNNSYHSNPGGVVASPRNTGGSGDYRLQPKNSVTTFTHNLSVDISKFLTQVEERELLNILRQSVLEIVFGSNFDQRSHPNHKLPSQKITNLDTTNHDSISSDYVIRPFIKGTHAMMYWDPAGHCYLVDRRFQFFTVRSQFYQAAHVGEGLLDGVLVVDTSGDIVFIAHDAATHQSKRLKDCWFSQRMHECRTAVADLNSSSDGSEPIHIIFLEAMPTNQVQVLLNDITIKQGGFGRTLSLGQREVPVHGLMFVPDKTGFHPTNGPKTYTWTFLEELVRDFKIKEPYDQEQVSLYAQGPRNVDACFQRCQFSEQHQERFLQIVADAERNALNQSFIVSCQFSKPDNIWIPVALQLRKKRASSVNSVAETTNAWENRLVLDDLLAQLLENETSI